MVLPLNSGQSQVRFELCHTYDVPGVYSLQIVVTDSVGLEDSRQIVAGVPEAYRGPEPS